MGSTTHAGGFRMGRATVLAVLLLAAISLATLALAASAQARGRAPTTLTITAQGVDLSGKVLSPRLSCLGNRNIRLYKQVGQVQNPNVDTLIATDTSARNGDHGEWSTGNTGIAGKFYVRTGRTTGCRAGHSATIRAHR
jgi:hypothetical protein